MPLSEYTDSIGGGLKLKGVKDGRVKKQKKKKAFKDTPTEDSNQPSDPTPDKEDENSVVSRQAEGQTANKYGKTETQLRHEERRRKMMDERIQREGVKSHKEKVEDLNKYLSKLSEHHDMPRIGPG